ncbi:acyl-CoA dehydrogenase [Bradyrhizobium sp. CSA207]|uniref:acyl-CoA dehydrogenase C-terminal domain-containing protein n=1 Tax=Bradyrhizobium sp. CSA207 TaxID=2698826 RepID=UPI0023AFA706|nr:acyl-CoA dehydrogenase C-terminal domain-containing protein [Bradyrhizobium sp. CSA207]MDE5444312.1 acyl-CoA dehydrogenase [Bradyrhizobium sp. CSA207]
MTTYRAPVQDLQFLLDDVLKIDRFNNLPGFSEATRDVRTAILSEAARLSEEVLHPLNSRGDIEGCTRHEDASVTLPQGFREAFKQLGEGGWIGLSGPSEYGGQDLPMTISCAVGEMFSSANMALEMFSGLTKGAVAALLVHGSEEQKQRYVPKMLSGQWTGTMNLTEPHCGTDLGMMRTKAVKQADGTYRITGTKIFISGGEHDMTENIVHLVLARVDGAPTGIKGVSLFVVPKRLVNEDGTLGDRNAVSCGSIEHKMGIHGNPTCVLNYEGATGWLVGRENKGMEAMFVMMNEARIGVGLQATSQSEVAYQNAANYAKERLQGRALGSPASPDKPADPIIVHPDVRRTLQGIRAHNQAARALVLFSALRNDVAHRSDDPAIREATNDFMGLLTPVIKGVLTDRGMANALAAQQMYGGHGYIVETGAEQFVRDVRITPLYEGANGIQALDLVARKLPRENGRAIRAFIGEVDRFIEENGGNDGLAPATVALRSATSDLKTATGAVTKFAMSDPNDAIAGSTDYMHLLGLVALGYMWAMMIKAAQEKIAAGERSDFLAAKLSTGAFFLERTLPETALNLRRILAGGKNITDVPAETF